MEQQQNVENILNKINNFINIDANRQKYTQHCDQLKNELFKKLRENSVFSYFFNGFQLGGSYGDNLKVSKPDEFDMVFHIKFPEQSLIVVEKDPALPGNVLLNFSKVLKKIEKEKQHQENLRCLRLWLDENNYLKVKSLQGYIESCFVKVLSGMTYCIRYNGKLATLRYSRQGPAHTIYVTESINFQYSIDFVPGILLSENQSIINIKGQWEAVPKPSKTNNPNYISFRASYFRQEHEIIKHKKQLKNVLRMMKKFRDAKTNLNKMRSYFIKTLFLHKTDKVPASYWEQSLQTIILDMFKEMEDSLRMEKLPFYWDKNLNLYDEFNSRLIREMLNCVEKSRETLVSAVNQLTEAQQIRVYKIFLDNKELEILRNETANNNSNSKNIPKTNENAGNPQAANDQNQSSCVIT